MSESKSRMYQEENFESSLPEWLIKEFLEISEDGELQSDFGLFDKQDAMYNKMVTDRKLFLELLNGYKNDYESDIEMEKSNDNDYEYLLNNYSDILNLLNKYANTNYENKYIQNISNKKELYKQLIEGYELSLEIETNEQKIKMYRDLIEGYELALELEDEEIQEEQIIEVEQIQEEMKKEVAQDDFEPSYLMTSDEYREKVTPLIQAYKKFLRKNSNYFTSPDYSGIAQYTLQEALELKDSPNAVFLGNFGREMSTEKQVRYNYSYKKTRDFNDEYTEPLVPQKLVDENKEFIKKLQKYFSIDDLNRRVQDDETKSNKRAIRRAIDNGIYKDLLSNNKVELSKLEMVTESVGVRLPKSIFDKSTQNQMKYETELGKLLSNIPILSFEKLKELIEQIKVDLIPLEELVYEQEYARYTELIKENIGKTKKAQSFGVVIPIWNLVYNYESEYRRENTPYKDWKGEYITESVQYVKLNRLSSDWEKQLASYLKEYVDNLKNSIIIALMRNFQNINMPIKSIERLGIKVGKKGFEGSYKFTFENGSSFVMNFQGVGAGGYNIQAYHFRYLTNFSNVLLADGSKGGTNYYEIADKFSTKRN